MTRIRHKVTGWTGTLLRHERYPKIGMRATVKWDWAFSARPVDPKLIEILP